MTILDILYSDMKTEHLPKLVQFKLSAVYFSMSKTQQIITFQSHFPIILETKYILLYKIEKTHFQPILNVFHS